MQRHAMASCDGVKAAVPTGRTVPIGEFGVRINVPPPAFAVVVIVTTPVAGVMTTLATLRVAVGRFAGKESFAVVPGIRQVRKGRLRGLLGELSAENLQALDECLEGYLH